MGNIILILAVLYLVGIVYYAIQCIKVHKELKRNKAVYSYRLDLVDRCYPDTGLMNKIVDKHTYKEMLQSSKPLEDIYWFTPEEIKEIDNNHVSHLMRTYLAEKIKEQ